MDEVQINEQTRRAWRQRQDDRSDDTAEAEGPRWPDPIDEAAFIGPTGEFVRIVEPHSEADPAALLVQFVVASGVMLGRHAHRIADGAQHFTNTFAILVGNTSKARKGSSWAQTRRVLDRVDKVFVADRVLSGLSSGEGLTYAVRDRVMKREAIREDGRATGEYQEVEADPGVDDKRLLVIESEFASVLKVCERETNTLSTRIRQAWDSGDLRTLTKTSPLRSTGAHIGIIGHITTEELLRALATTEAANGFANRFLWICCRRSKVLPFGGSPRDIDLEPIAAALRRAVEWSRTAGEIEFSAEAREAWIRTYPKLSEGRAGLLGAVLARAEAQVLRLSLLYAVLDCSGTIELVHLRAALAIWEYAERSAEFIFGDSLGDPEADAILAALRGAHEGLTRTGIRDLFARHLSTAAVERALNMLVRQNLVTHEQQQTAGRAAELWKARVATKATEATKGM